LDKSDFNVSAYQAAVSGGGDAYVEDSWSLDTWIQVDAGQDVLGSAVSGLENYSKQNFGDQTTIQLGTAATGRPIPSLTPGTYTVAGITLSRYGCKVGTGNYAGEVKGTYGTAFHIVVEPTPVITSISPSPISADTPSQPFTITGSGLGTSGTISFSPQTQQSHQDR